MKYVIETNKLTQRFRGKIAIDQLDLKVPAGSIYALLGPNGAGKTTAIKTIMNIIPATSGKASILSVDSKRMNADLMQQVGYVSENQDILEWMTIIQFFDYCASFYIHWDQSFCHFLTKKFQLPLNQKIGTLSRGMRMKVALISSIAYHPKVLILDEPFSGLDPLVREDFINGILEITENQEWAVLLSSHDMDEVEKLADWVGVIHKGQLKISEQTEFLQNRFKHIEIYCDKPLSQDISYEAHWLLPEQKGRVVHFYDSQYESGKSEKRIKEVFAQRKSPVVTEMSLKEIFIVLTKYYKIFNF